MGLTGSSVASLEVAVAFVGLETFVLSLTIASSRDMDFSVVSDVISTSGLGSCDGV